MPADSPTVAPDSFVTLHYRITLTDIADPGDNAGKDFLNTFDGKPATLQMGSGQMAPGLEAALVGAAQGTRDTVDLPAELAWGPRNPELMQRVAMSLLRSQSEIGTDFAPGDVVEFTAPQGGQYAGVCKSVDDFGAWFDFNHPLAGQAIRFEYHIIGVL
jgi:FKBP-type peptidyl-prolyl cis-trans isomerase SlpA